MMPVSRQIGRRPSAHRRELIRISAIAAFVAGDRSRSQPGKNYGWPIISDGMDYSTNRPYPETIGTSASGMESPYHVWKKSPGLTGMAFYTGHPESRWNNSLFLGALADRNLIRLSLDGDRIVGEERLLGDLGARIRDVRVGDDGSIYVLTDEDDGKLLKLQPSPSH